MSPMILFRNMIIIMLGGERNKLTFGRIRHKFRVSSNKNNSMAQYVGTLRGCRIRGCYFKVYESICHAEGFELLLAKVFWAYRRSDHH